MIRNRSELFNRQITRSKVKSFTVYNVIQGQIITSPNTGEKYIMTKTALEAKIIEERYSIINVSFPCSNISKVMDLMR